jgi:hypothetical protein
VEIFRARLREEAALAYMRSRERRDLLFFTPSPEQAMTQRRSVHSAGSPAKTPEPTTGANPDGRTPAELPSDTSTPNKDKDEDKGKKQAKAGHGSPAERSAGHQP